MVINVNTISESALDNMFHEAEIFVLESCHELDMTFMESYYLNESNKNKETINDKINKFIIVTKRKIEEITAKAIQYINEIYSKFSYYIENNFIKKNFANRENKSEIESITREETKKYLENNPYYSFPKANEMDYVLNNLRRDLTVSEYMEAHDVSKNYANQVADTISDSFINYNSNDTSILKDIKDIKSWRDSFIKQVNDSKEKIFANSDNTAKKTLEDRKKETPVFKAAMNLYMSTLKCRVANIKARIAIGKNVIKRLNESDKIGK